MDSGKWEEISLYDRRVALSIPLNGFLAELLKWEYRQKKIAFNSIEWIHVRWGDIIDPENHRLSIPLNGFAGGELGEKTHVKKLSIPLNGFSIG